MATKKKVPTKKAVPKKSNRSTSRGKKSKRASSKQENDSIVMQMKSRRKDLLSRRPHRAFRRTRRRDYVRSLKLPGYISFTKHVLTTLSSRWKLYGKLIIVFSIASALLAGIASQQLFTDFVDSLETAGKDILTGGWGEVGKAGILLAGGITGRFTVELDEIQQVYASIVLILAWLTTVWLLRAQLAGSHPCLRDGLYNAGAPIIATCLVFIVFLLQLVPMALASIVYSSVLSSGLLSNALYSMVAFFLCIMFVVLSLYLITSTFFALVVATLPGMYPWRALRIAGDLVIGRRLRILYRLAWAILVVVVGWVLLMTPAIFGGYLIHKYVPMLDWLPLVPIVLLVASTATIVFLSSYIYLLYRKVVDDDASPA